MRFGKNDDKLWVFVWTPDGINPHIRPYPTSLVSHTRTDLIRFAARELGRSWKTIYRQGGRAVRCRLIPIRAVHVEGNTGA